MSVLPPRIPKNQRERDRERGNRNYRTITHSNTHNDDNNKDNNNNNNDDDDNNDNNKNNNNNGDDNNNNNIDLSPCSN